jgi:CBS domain-containing protein
MFTIEAIMSADPITIAKDASLADARSIMHEKHIHHLPIVNDKNEVVGLVTLTDVLAATDSFLRDDDSRIHATEIVVSDVMVRDVATVDRHASLRSAALFLEKHRIGCLPVVENNALCGIITETDFVAVAINLLEQLEASEPDDFDDDEFDEDVA